MWFFGVGEGVFGLEGGGGGGDKGLGAGFALGGLFAERLELLRLAAQPADLRCAWFGDEIAHTEILSHAGPASDGAGGGTGSS